MKLFKKIGAAIAAGSVATAMLVGLTVGAASANGLDGPGAYHDAYDYAVVACHGYANYLTYDDYEFLQVAVLASGQAYQDSQSLPSNFQQFYGDFAVELSNVQTAALNQRYDGTDEGLAYTACTWILAP